MEYNKSFGLDKVGMWCSYLVLFLLHVNNVKSLQMAALLHKTRINKSYKGSKVNNNQNTLSGFWFKKRHRDGSFSNRKWFALLNLLGSTE